MERLKVAHIVLFQVGMEFSAAVSASNENNIEDFPDFLVVCFTANKINKLVIKTSTTPRLGKCIILLWERSVHMFFTEHADCGQTQVIRFTT